VWVWPMDRLESVDNYSPASRGDLTEYCYCYVRQIRCRKTGSTALTTWPMAV